MALNYGFGWGQPEALVASTLIGGARHAAAHLLLLLLMGQAMLTILLCTQLSRLNFCTYCAYPLFWQTGPAQACGLKPMPDALQFG